jgi:hypothetical protein
MEFLKGLRRPGEANAAEKVYAGMLQKHKCAACGNIEGFEPSFGWD